MPSPSTVTLSLYGGPRGKPTIALNAKEQRVYSMSGALYEQARAQLEHRKPKGLAFDISQDLERDVAEYHGGLIVPMNLRAGLDSATSTKGAELKFAQDMSWLDMLRIQSVVARCGATFVDDLWGGAVTFPEITTQTAPVWAAQNPGSDQAENDPAFTTKTANPHSLMANTAFTLQLLQQSRVRPNNAVDRIVAIDIARAHAVLIDGAAIGGTGGSQPTGVATQLTGAQLIAAGVNGAQPVWANIVDMEAAVAVANADFPDNGDDDTWPKHVCAWVTTPQIRQRMRKTDRAGGVTGWMISADEQRTKMLGSPLYVSKSVPSTLTKGTSSGICHAMVFGLWSQLYVCQFGPGIELVSDPYTLKKQGIIAVASYQMIDIVIARTGSFAGMLDLLP